MRLHVTCVMYSPVPRVRMHACRGAVKLYSDFLQSDIVVASPIALATKLSEESDEEGGLADFLSSIEIAIVDRADVQLMQNWAHVVTGDPYNLHYIFSHQMYHAQ